MSVIKLILNEFDKLHTSEKKVAEYIINNSINVTIMSVSELAKASDVSVATVVRTCQHLGFDGFYQMKLLLAKDVGFMEMENDDELIGNNDPISYIFLQETNYLNEINNKSNRNAIIESTNLIKNSERIFIVASGNTIPIALDFEFRLNRLSFNAFTSTTSERAINYIGNSTEDDLLVAISRSGISNPVRSAISLSKKHKSKVVAITADKDSPVATESDVVIDINGNKDLLFKNYGLTSHIGEMIIIDTIITLLEVDLNYKNVLERSSDLEILLSYWKL